MRKQQDVMTMVVIRIPPFAEDAAYTYMCTRTRAYHDEPSVLGYGEPRTDLHTKALSIDGAKIDDRSDCSEDVGPRRMSMSKLDSGVIDSTLL